MKLLRRQTFFPFLSLLFLLCCSCATKPPAEKLTTLLPQAPAQPRPTASLGFERIEAVTPETLSLIFLLKAENSGAEPVRIRAEGFRAAVNSVEQNELSGLALEEEILEAASSGSYPLRFETALTAELFRDLQDPAGEAALSAELVFTYASGEEIKTTVEALGIFPIIRKPEVRITAIAVKKADLINTRFKVSLRIDNPNSFPVELSSFNYELYNAGRLWADGVKEDVLAVPPESSAETELLLVMNFLNMNRELLNQVAAMRDISYRFTGKAEVSTGIGYFPGFSIKYDLSGHAEVSE